MKPRTHHRIAISTVKFYLSYSQTIGAIKLGILS